MSFQVTEHFVQQYRANVTHLAQQKGSRLRNTVMVETNVVGKSAFIDFIGKVAARKVTERHGDSPLNPTPHSRRRVTLFDYDTGDLVDKLDKIRMLNDPTSDYAQAHAWAMGRGMDDELINAFFATVYTGEDGATQVTFPAANQVAVNDWTYGTGSGNAGLTISKLISAKTLIGEADVDPDEPWFIAVAPKQVANLLETTEATSADYNTVKALVEGKIDTFMGFKFIQTNRLLTDSNSYRRLPVWTPSGMGLAIGQDIMGRIAERSDKRFAMYVYFCMAIGAVRAEEKKVYEIKCAE